MLHLQWRFKRFHVGYDGKLYVGVGKSEHLFMIIGGNIDYVFLIGII